ncbi:MAG: GTP pyrophosphokinase family protein [Terriglobales bacterium]
MSDVEQARLRWINERSRHQAFGALLRDQLGSLLKPLGIWFEVDARAKEIDSLVKKLLRKQGHTFDSLPDKVGVRVIVRYRSDLQGVIDVVSSHFEAKTPDDKVKGLGTDRVGYQSVHLDHVRLRSGDPNAIEYPPTSFWAELQVRTLAQHLWSEMSHDTVYKNDEMVSALPDDAKRRVNLMAGQIEVSDREFDRLNEELSSQPAVRLLHALERHYYTLSSRRPDLELSMQVLNTLMPLVKGDVQEFTNHLDDFLSSKHGVLETVYAQASKAGVENITSFLFQPEALMLYELLSSNLDATRRVWNQNYPEPELERIANAFGISLD